MLAGSAASPSPLWFATRGAGVMTLVCLTGVVVLGIATSLRVGGQRSPRFVVAALHRNFALFTIVLLGVHIVTDTRFEPQTSWFRISEPAYCWGR